MPEGPVLAEGILIPRKGVLEIARAIENRNGPCEVGVYQGNLVVKADEMAISVKLLDAQFPPYEQVVPKDSGRSVVLARMVMLEALRRVAIMSSDKSWGVRFSLEKGKLRMESENPDLGAAKEEIEVAYKGQPVSIGFNARYFIELLSEIETDEVRLELSGELDPGVLRPADGSDYVGIVMPMRI